jgi:RNA polymerase sigma factor (sigma-70 family)
MSEHAWYHPNVTGEHRIAWQRRQQPASSAESERPGSVVNAEVATRKLDNLSDRQLVERAQQGERDAFAELYDRYFEPIYDFLTRMMRNRAEAEDTTQDTFIRAMNSLGNLENPGSFKSWLFTIARNTALNRIERTGRTRPMPEMGDGEGQSMEMFIVDSDRLGNPQDAVQAEAVASLVWEAASGLNPKQYSLLDLHVRQGLDSGDIAGILNVSRNNAYVMLTRMKAALAETVTAYIMMNEGRNSCADLDAALNRAAIKRFSPAARKVVTRHIDSCAYCQDRQSELVSPVAILGALVPVPAAPGVMESIRNDVLSQWPGAGAASVSADQPSGGTNIGMLASIASVVLGVLLIALVFLVMPGEANSGNQSTANSGFMLIFQNDAGELLPGVGVQIYAQDDRGRVYSGTTNSNGAITWRNATAGTYDVVLGRVPEEFGLPDSERVYSITIAPGEELVLTATLQTR